MMQPDYLIVGSGLTGATLARTLTDLGATVLVVERRPWLGGAVADEVHASGIRMSRYGPHYFRTSSPEVWQFANRFATFDSYAAIVQSRVHGHCENWPIAADYIRRTVGECWAAEFTDAPTNFEEAALALMPRAIYEDFVRGYTEKQWGVPARELAASLCRRFDVRADDDPRLTPDRRYQGLPAGGYSRWVERMLAGIPVLLNCDFLAHRSELTFRRALLFSGPLDAYFEYALGRLTYRGQRRESSYWPDAQWLQPCAQVNEPGRDVQHIRTIEWKHLLPAPIAERIAGTVLTRETPFTPTDPDQYEYPFPDERNQQLYRGYCILAAEQPNVVFCGRLGEYRYYDMDHAIARARTLARRIASGVREPVAASA